MMTRVSRGLALVMLLGTVPALAQQGLDEDLKEDRQDRRDRRQAGEGSFGKAAKERLRKEMELRRTLKIADELGLNESQSLAISAVLKDGDAKTRELMEQLRTQVQELKDVADGSPTQKDVDGRIKRIQELRMQALKQEGDTFEAASKGLTPTQKAKLALVVGAHEREMRGLMLKHAGKRRDRQDGDNNR